MPSWFGSAYTKLHIWTLTEYTQVFYIDADCMVMKPLDHMFKAYEECDFAASPDVFPPDHFNAGVLLIRPNMKVFMTLLRKSQQAHQSYDGGDTGFLNQIFNVGWYSGQAVIPATPQGATIAPVNQQQSDEAGGDTMSIVQQTSHIV